MEELLERLIKNWWKPFGDNRCTYHIEYNDYEIAFYRYDYRSDDDRYERIFNKSIRDLVSKESWLWQFVCENGMVAEKSEWILYRYDDYKYRLTNCALKDESELEDFLLSNIKVNE